MFSSPQKVPLYDSVPHALVTSIHPLSLYLCHFSSIVDAAVRFCVAEVLPSVLAHHVLHLHHLFW